MPSQRIACEQFASVEELRNPAVRCFNVVPSDISPNLVKLSQRFAAQDK
jgi:hypothetical protein